ncbi:MAG: hypothetical protein JRG94_20565, partial [Deltaproteobacteria bacterium]|nr:hypothetical protein [Deltaproteobacteria bacterium]
GDPELLFLASNEPIEVEQTAARALADSPEDFERLGLFVPEDVNARLLLDEAAVRELAEAAPVNRDDHNLLQLRSPQIFDRSLVAGLGDLVSPYEPILDARRHDNDNNNDNNNNNDFFYLIQIVPAARAIGIVDRIEEGVDREVAQAMLDLAAGRRQTARQRLIEVLEGSPRHLHARAQLLDMRGRSCSTCRATPSATGRTPSNYWKNPSTSRNGSCSKDGSSVRRATTRACDR